ncbi:uncharacterized protein LOC127730159 [Mytilus californianus]|uniref:uncharacterized protein LOC127730159 n=1 Tax=Mytilus californianus TaxID=6549 RepID=UPI0022476E0A|nr:uncharacterized protein LOC127730159 [Mytilus californianus]
MWSTDNWAPGEDEMQLEILDLDINGEQKIPTGQPNPCQPDYEKLNLTLGAAAIKKMKVYLTYEENEWWQNFFRNQTSVQNNEAIWPLSNIAKLHRLEDMQIIPQVNLGTSCLRPMLDAEEEVREVVTKRRKNKTARNTET